MRKSEGLPGRDQLVNQPFSQLISQSVIQLISQSIFFSQSASQLVRKSAHPLKRDRPLAVRAGPANNIVFF